MCDGNGQYPSSGLLSSPPSILLLLLIPSDAGLLNPNNSKFTRRVLANHWDIYANDNNSDQIRSL